MSIPISSQLDQARERLKVAAPSEPYMTVEEAAKLARCNPITIRRAFHSGTLPAFRRAHRVLLKAEDVRAWIESAPVHVKQPPSRPPTQRRGQPSSPGSVAALREIERELSR